jgi:hypothetical protein
MKFRVLIKLLLLGLVVWVDCATARAQTLQVPPFPQNLDLSSVARLYKSAAYKVEVRRAGTTNYTECFVFETRNDWVLRDYWGKDPNRVIRAADEMGDHKGNIRTASFTQFSFADTAVDVRVTLLAPDAVARSVTVRPLRHEIPAKIGPDGKTITFSLAAPLKISVEINDRLNPLFLFADAPDVPDTSATYYFGPGVHRLPGDGKLTLTSGQHVYIAAGAILEGRFVLAKDSKDIRVAGRGILSMGEWPHMSSKVSFCISNSTFYSLGTSHFVLEGLTLVQGSAWTVAIENTDHAAHDNLYQNIKMVHFSGNTDAFWISGDRNRVEDCFVFNNDDAIVTKGGNDSVVTNLVFWGGVWGRFVLFQNNGVNVTNLTFENVDVIGKEGGPCLILGETARGLGQHEMTLQNMTLRNIRFEQRNNSGDFNIGRLFWLRSDKFSATLDHWLFENITLDQQFADEGCLFGSADHPYSDITFKNLRMGGKLVLSPMDSHISTNTYVSCLQFLPPGPSPGKSH